MSRYKEGRYSIARRNQRYKKYFLMGKDPPPESTSDSEGESPGSHQMSPDYSYKRSPDTNFKRVDNVNDAIEVLMAPTKKPEPAFEDKYPYFYPLKPPPLPKEEHESVIASQPLPQQTDIERKETDSTGEKVRSRSSSSSSTSSSSSSAGSASPSSASTHSSDAKKKESSGTEEAESISDKDEGMQGDEIVATKMTVEQQPEEMSEFKEKETQEEVAVTGEDQKQPEEDETVVVLEHEEPSDSGVKPVAAVAAAIPLISKTRDKDKEDKVSSSAPYGSTPAEGSGQETMETHSEHEECIPDETHPELTFTVATSYPSESTQAAQEPEIVVITSDPERERRDSVSSHSSFSSSSSSSTSTSDRQESPVKVPPQKPSIPPPLPPKQQEKGDVTAGHLESSSPPHSPPPPPPQFADGDKPITDDSIQMAEQSHIRPEDIETIVQEDVTVKISPPHSPPPPPPVSPPVSPTDEGPPNDSISEQSTLGESPQPPLPDMPPPSKLLLLVQDRSEDGHATCEYIPVSPTPESPPSPTKEETPNEELSIPPLSTSPPDITPETPVIETHDKPDAHAIPGQKKELDITEEPATNIVDTTNYFAVECEGGKGEGEDKSPDIEEDADMVQAIMKSVALSYQSKQEPITQSGDDSTLGDQTIEEEEPLQDSSAEFEDSNISVSNIDTMPSSTPLAVTAAAKSLQQGDQEVEQSVPDVIGSINETQRESQEIEPPADAPLEVNVTISSQDDETIHADDSELKEDTSMGVTPESIMIYSIDDESEANVSKHTVAPASPDIITQEKDATPEISESKAAEKETISPEKVDTAEKKVKSEEISEIQPADKGNVNIEKKKVAAVAVASKPKDTRQTPPARPVQKAPTSPKEGDQKAKQKKGKKLGIFNFLIESPSKHKAEKMAKKREKEAAKQAKKTEKEVEKVTKKPEKEPEHRVSAKSTKSEKAKKPVKSEKPEKSAKPMKVYGKKGKDPQYQSTGMAVDAEPPPLSKKSKKPPKEAVVAGAVVAKRGKGNRETEHRKSIEAQMHGYDEPRAVKASTLEREEKKHAKHDAETPGPETERGEQQKEDIYTSKQKDKAKRESDYDRKKDHKSTGKRATLMKLPESEAGKAEQIEKSEAKTVMRKASKDQLLGDEPQQTKANYAKTPGQENVSVSKTAATDSQSVPVGSENVAKDPSEEQYPQQGHSPKQEKPEPVYATINEEHKKSQQSLLDDDKSQAENERQSPPPPSPPTPPPKNFTSSDELQDTSLPLPSPPPHGVFQYEEQERPPQDPDTPKEKEPTQEPSSTASAEKQKPLHQPHTYDTPSDAKQAVHDDSYMIPRNQGQSKPEPTYTNTASSQTAPEHIPSQAAVSHQVVEKVPVYHQQQEEEAPLYSYSSKKAQSLPDIQQDEPKTQGTQTDNNQHRPDQHDAYDRPRAAQEPAGQQNNNKKQDELSPIIEGHQSTGKHNVGSMTDDNLSENSFLSESNRDRELPSPGYFDDDDESLYSSQSQASRYDRRYKSFSDDRDLTRRGRLQKGYSEPTVSRSESGDSDPDVIRRRQKRTQRRRAQEKPVRHSYAFEDDDRQRRQSEKQSKTFMLNRSRLESKTRSQQDIDIEPIKVKKLELKNTSL
ncbi:treacle protein-like [Ptychodera flava]|uniref:treacle protein-like n=1 Tax=Ptychodera flava TaxID=63121 RepID=UPI003969C0FB